MWRSEGVIGQGYGGDSRGHSVLHSAVACLGFVSTRAPSLSARAWHPSPLPSHLEAVPAAPVAIETHLWLAALWKRSKAKRKKKRTEMFPAAVENSQEPPRGWEEFFFHLFLINKHPDLYFFALPCNYLACQFRGSVLSKRALLGRWFRPIWMKIFCYF